MVCQACQAYQAHLVQHLRREPYRAQNRDRRDSEGNEVQKDTQASKELKGTQVFVLVMVVSPTWGHLGSQACLGHQDFWAFQVLKEPKVIQALGVHRAHQGIQVYLGLEVQQALKERKGTRLSAQDQGCQEIEVILAPRGSLVRQEPQARMEYQVYQGCQAFWVMVHRASPVKRGYQDFLVKKATLVQLAPQESGYQGLLDLVDFLEIKE